MFINFDVHAGGEERARRRVDWVVVLFVSDRKFVVHALHASGTMPNITCFSVILFIITCAAINKWIWSITFCLAHFHKYGRQDLPHWSPRSSLQSPKSSLRSPRSSLWSPRSKGRPRCDMFVLLFCKFTAKFFLQRKFTPRNFFRPSGQRIA